MDLDRCRAALKNPECDSAELAKCLAGIDIPLMERELRTLQRRRDRELLTATTEAIRTLDEEIILAELGLERAYAASHQLRRRLAEDEAREAQAARHPHPPGFFIKGDEVLVYAGDAHGTTLSFTLSAEQMQELSDALDRASIRLQQGETDRTGKAEAIEMRASA